MARTILDDWNLVAAVLDEAEVLNLSMVEQGENGPAPYCVPVNFARAGKSLYLHSGLKGRKLEALAATPVVCFTALTGLELKTADTACKIGYHFRSVVGFGTAKVVESAEERQSGMRAIVEKWERLAGLEGPLPMNEKTFDTATVVLRIDVTSATLRER